MSREADRIRREAQMAVQLSVAEAAKVVLARAKALAPRGDPNDDPHAGDLVESGRIDFSTDRRRATVGFYTPYAARQHENRQYQHPHGGQAHYLSKAILEVVKGMDDIMAHNIRRQVGEDRRR